jgi:hypothetical protein
MNRPLSEQTNPYSVPISASFGSDRRPNLRWTTWLGLIAGVILIAVVLALAGWISYLYYRYPGLNDPPSHPVSYWPELEVELSTLAIVVATPVALAILLPTLSSLRRQLADRSRIKDAAQ